MKRFFIFLVLLGVPLFYIYTQSYGLPKEEAPMLTAVNEELAALGEPSSESFLAKTETENTYGVLFETQNGFGHALFQQGWNNRYRLRAVQIHAEKVWTSTITLSDNEHWAIASVAKPPKQSKQTYVVIDDDKNELMRLEVGQAPTIALMKVAEPFSGEIQLKNET
ncbi:hypothetical protein G4V62_07195 [Bacillaceae bacterium SIJ1]|uniref:hypothetical protein n=1 Tax=Litoribacterium kuwaitense TaxID=1398745 RepID=UPI0013ED1601|nr:hypothetical protein [Litoribacterium kuwaitense]NGP44751.1 hypothetical protein [Litoribacterium kuwaitense]